MRCLSSAGTPGVLISVLDGRNITGRTIIQAVVRAREPVFRRAAYTASTTMGQTPSARLATSPDLMRGRRRGVGGALC
jgi:hypothetical protein